MTKTICFLLAAATACASIERATYDSAGRLTTLVDQGATLPVLGHFVLVTEDGREVVLQPHDQRSPITREGRSWHWQGSPLDPLASGVRFDVQWEQRDKSLALQGAVTTALPRRIGSIDYVLALPRSVFHGGQIAALGAHLPETPGPEAAVAVPNTRVLRLYDGKQEHTVELRLDRARNLRVSDTWTRQGRWYEVRIPLHHGAWATDQPVTFQMEVQLTAQPPAREAQLALRSDEQQQPFIGFGANYCWVNTSPVTDYTLEHLQSTWLRFELKFIAWVAQRENPGELLRRDFELMRRIQQDGHPWIISLWRLPEDYYVPRESGASAMGHGRRIAPDRWPQFLQELGDFLLYLKQHYGAEPDMFSFNEPDLGVDIAFSPEEHRDVIKRIGAHFAKIGLKTKLMAGETANPRNAHLYVLPTAADPEAMQYVAGVSFHSWGGATPEQYGAWADVAAWMDRPLFVGEAGMDPGAYRNRAYDSYGYGLREMEDHFDFIRYARVQASLYWQFTNDYSLVHVQDDGAIIPTGRFHLMRHLSNLTPQQGHVVGTSSDQPDVHIIAFRDGARTVVHLLNTGSAVRARLDGAASGPWKRITTTEEAPFHETPWQAGNEPLDLPARSMTTLQR